MTEEDRVRLDKWLWAARFFKTRSQASTAISGGRVHVNGARVKPARFAVVGDTLRIQKDHDEYLVVIRAISGQRRGAPEAQLLYEETAQSRERREMSRENRRLLRAEGIAPPGRPSKRDRRLIKKFTRKDE